MVTKIQKWGNSQGIRLSRRVLEDAHMALGEAVDVVVRDGEIVVRPARRVRGRYDLGELVSRIPADSEGGEVDWGLPEGREVW